jgi:hypothetical protein
MEAATCCLKAALTLDDTLKLKSLGRTGLGAALARHWEIMSYYYELTPKIVEEAFKKLLSEKHMYQSVSLDLNAIKKDADEQEMERSRPGSSRDMPSKHQLMDMGKKELQGTWIPAPDQAIGAVVRPSVAFKVPSVTTYCDQCGAAWPHNPTGNIAPIGDGQNQCFFFEYQCQKCQSALVRFQIRREGLKIKLTGRDPIEVLPTPKELPKEMSRFFSTAHVAHNAGQTLAGIFLLRTFIEQYWRSLPEVQKLTSKHSKATGDEMGDAYQDALPKDFKERFPSLKDIYGRLSEAMHAANDDAAVFEDCSAKIIKHFKARKLFEL